MWATVKFSDKYYPSEKNNIIHVPISKVWKEIKVNGNVVGTEPFLPVDVDDFSNSVWYLVKTKEKAADNHEHWYHAMIGRIAGM